MIVLLRSGSFRSFPIALAAVVFLLCSTSVLADPVSEVRESIRKMNEAARKGDIDGFLSHFADDAIVTAGRKGFRVEGKQRLKVHYLGLWQQYPSRTRLGRQGTYRVYLDGKVVIRNLYAEQTWKDANGQTSSAMLRVSQTWVNNDGRWLIVDSHSSKITGVQ